MYDGLYALIADDVDVVVHADHPTLNREVAARLAAGERLDVVSTHGKYAPSQAAWLRPLDDLVDPAVLAPLAPKAVELCSFQGSLLCVPRNIDVRVLWWRTDLLDAPPETWALAPRYVTLMLAVRFLTDHLEGDRYFRVRRAGENLARAHVQFGLLEAFERQEGALIRAFRAR